MRLKNQITLRYFQFQTELKHDLIATLSARTHQRHCLQKNEKKSRSITEIATLRKTNNYTSDAIQLANKKTKGKKANVRTQWSTPNQKNLWNPMKNICRIKFYIVRYRNTAHHFDAHKHRWPQFMITVHTALNLSVNSWLKPTSVNIRESLLVNSKPQACWKQQ